MSLLAVSSRRLPSVADDASSLTGDSRAQSSSVVQPLMSDCQRDACPATSASSTDVGRSSGFTPRTCADDDAGHTQRMPDSVWSEFTETFRVIELAVSEGLRCSIDAPTTAFQPELELSADVPPADRDNRQYSLQLARRDVTARRQCEYDVTCAAVARRRDGDDVRYAVSYNRWITVARQPAAGARQPATYEAINRQAYDENVVSCGDGDYKPKDECSWAGYGAAERADSWVPAWPAVKQEQIEERPSCAYQLWSDDTGPSCPRYRSTVSNEFKDCRYATVSYNKVHKIMCSIFVLL